MPFLGDASQLQFYTCSCRYSPHASVSSPGCGLCEGRKHACSAHPCLAIVDSVYICGIDGHMGRMAGWMDRFHCHSPLRDFWFVSRLHCLPLPIGSSLLLSSINMFFLKDCTHDLMPHTSLTCRNITSKQIKSKFTLSPRPFHFHYLTSFTLSHFLSQNSLKCHVCACLSSHHTVSASTTLSPTSGFWSN